MEFESFAHLARHVSHIQHMSDEFLTAALAVSAHTLLKEMKPMFGVYQSGAGSYPAWAPLAPRTIKERTELGFPANEPLLRTGELRDSYQVKAGRLWAGVGSTLEKAYVLEVGDPGRNLPARSILGIAFVHCEKKSFSAISGMGALFVGGKIPTRTAISLI